MNATVGAAKKYFDELLVKYDNFGARDSEGLYAIDRVEEALLKGGKFPLTGFNPFDLYESKPGWQEASEFLIAAARSYWRAAVIENLGLGLEDLAQ